MSKDDFWQRTMYVTHSKALTEVCTNCPSVQSQLSVASMSQQTRRHTMVLVPGVLLVKSQLPCLAIAIPAEHAIRLYNLSWSSNRLPLTGHYLAEWPSRSCARVWLLDSWC